MSVGGGPSNGQRREDRTHTPPRQKRRTTRLMYACQQQDTHTVKRIIEKQPDQVFQVDRTLKTALHYCAGGVASASAAQCADLLVMQAPELVDSRDEDGFTPLHLAVIAGNVQLVQFLLANGADVNALDSERHSVVHWATVCGEAAALCAVLAVGAEVSTPDVHGGFPLHYAAQMCGSDREQLGLQVLHILLSQSNCDVSVEDNDGRQPLLWAASAGSAKAVLALARAGANVEAPDKDGLTALHCAASRGHTNCLDTLLTLCGAQPDVIDSNGCTALHYAVTLGHADATSLLLSHSSDPNRQDRRGRTPAHCGCAKGQLETLRLLARHGANLWLRNARGDLPLHEAAASGRRDLLTWLLDQRPSQVNARNNDGRSALHLAALNDNSDMCKILIDAGAYVNPVFRTSKNVLMTPLDCAMQRGFRSTAKFLQLHGGLPANRLTNLRVGSDREISTNVSVSSSLHVREDVTVLGATSTESDVDEEKKVRPRRRSVKRKVAYKYSKTASKGSISDEDTQIRAKDQDGVDDNKNKNNNKTVEDLEKQTNIKVTNEKTKTTPPQFEVEKSNIKNGKITSPTDEKDQTKIPRQRPKSAKKRDSLKKKSSTEVSESITVEGNVSVEKEHDNGQKNIEADLEEKNEKSSKITVEASVHEPPKMEENDRKVGDETGDSSKDQSKNGLPKDSKSPKTSPRTQEQMTTKTTIEDTSITTTVEISEPTCNQNNLNVEKEIVIEQKITIGSPRTKEKLQKEKIIIKETVVEEQNTKEEEEKIKKDLEQKKIEEEVKSRTVGKVETGEQNSVGNVGPGEQISVGKVDSKGEIPSGTKEEQIPVGKTETLDSVDKSEDTKTDDTVLEKKQLASDMKQETIQEVDISLEEKENSGTKKEESPKVVGSPKSPKSPKSPRKVDQLELKMKSNEINIDLSLKKFEESADLTDSTTTEVVTVQKQKRYKKKLKTIKDEAPETSGKISQSDHSSSENDSTRLKRSESLGHKSFQVIDEEAPFQVLDEEVISGKDIKGKRRTPSRLLEPGTQTQTHTPDTLVIRSRSVSREKDRIQSSCETHISLPLLPEKTRSESNLSAPNLLGSIYSDGEQKTDSASDGFIDDLSSASRKKKLKKRSRVRLGSKSAGSDYESSVLIDSGFEPSPRSSRIPKRKVVSERGVNMTTVTQSIQSNIRRFHMERKIFQHLLDLKRLQIRSGQSNEAVLVKRAIDTYNSSIAATVGAGRYQKKDFTYRGFEQFLYHSLRMLQKNIAESLKDLPVGSDNPLLCTKSTHRCMHTTHAYTGVPCAAYIPKLNHHTIPKIGFSHGPNQKSQSQNQSFLPQINNKGKAVTLELCHGSDKQVISLPADRLDQNKRYYVTFTVKGQETQLTTDQGGSHRHAKSV